MKTAIPPKPGNRATVKKTIPVTGMSCASCSAAVEKSLLAQPGVHAASVNYANHSAAVEWSADATSAETLQQAIRSLGYDLVLDENTGSEAAALRKEDARQLQIIAVVALALSTPLVIIGMFFMEMPYADYIMWALATPVVVFCGRRFFINAVKMARHRSATMDTLVALSTGIAYAFSVFNTLVPHFWHRRGLHAHVYFESAAVVIAFVLLGRLLEERAKANTSSALRKLMGLQPKTVLRLNENGDAAETPIAKIMVGDLLLARPGDHIALDGVVESGQSWTDESMLSGEPVPVLKNPGDHVFAGTINQQGSFRFRAQKVGSETVLAQIVKAVQEAQGSKAPVQQLVEKIAGVFVPVVMGIALLSLAGWTLLGGENGFSQGLMAMVTVLVIACPCALGLATPTAIMVGIGKGAENGILIRDARSLEIACKVTEMVLDKTGTLTIGKPEIQNVVWTSGADRPEHAALFLGLENASSHPLAVAVARYFSGGEVAAATIENVREEAGKGITGTAAGHRYRAGSIGWIKESGVAIPDDLERVIEEWGSAAVTLVAFADDTRVLAVAGLSDALRKEAPEAVATLHAMGVKTWLLTGDNAQAASVVAGAAGIPEFTAGALPADKERFVQDLQQQSGTVAMVGDGINDSPALARADLGIAMGTGADIAMDVARVTLLSSDLRALPKAISLSRKTVRVIRQNLFWAFFYNLIGIPIAAGLLYPVNGFLLNPMLAGAAMALSSVSVVCNSLRLKWSRI